MPVIVSLEVHCSKEQQEIMVEIMNETWAQFLVQASPEECKHLPSPSELKKKILVKVKYVPPQTVMKEVAKSSTASRSRRARSSSTSSSSEDQDAPVGEEKNKNKKSAITQALSALGIYTRSYHFKTLGAPESSVPTHVFSLSEDKFAEVHQKEGDLLFLHNKHFLMRAFPSGMRVASSNLDPSRFWRRGVQIVALNWQKRDRGMMLNEAMFADSQGWVLKPKSYRGHAPGIAQDSSSTTSSQGGLSVSVRIFSGQKIALPIGETSSNGFHPYVKCELHVERLNDHPENGRSDPDKCKQRTKTAKGCNPDFQAEEISFPLAYDVIQGLAFLR